MTILPSLQKQTGQEGFILEAKGGVSVENEPLFTTEVCFTPKDEIAVGTHRLALAPYGGWVAQKQYSLAISEPPTLADKALEGAKVSAVRPVTIKLTSADAVNTYNIENTGKKATCDHKDAVLSCDLTPLELAHGANYAVTLYRSYENSDEIKVAEANIVTINALQLQSASIENDQTVYDKPSDFRFTFDKPIKTVKATLVRYDGETEVKVSQTATASEAAAVITLSDTLSRNTRYKLTLQEVEGVDGGSLAEPITRTFTVSGGPKVSGVSIGQSGVGQTATAIITFDQPLAEDVEVAKFARLAGFEGASARRQAPNQIAISFQNAPLCAAFTIEVSKGIASGSNDEQSTEDWRYTSRIICGSSSVMGYSVRGRPIVAYYFGSGSTTILFTGGMHGSEPSSTSTMQAWVQYLQANAHTLPADKRIVVVPNTNPDGIAAGSRNNANNVNLARNYPTNNWSSSIETASGTLEHGGGTEPGSEPETKALMSLTNQVRPRLQISYHAQGRLVGANKVADSVAIGSIYAGIVGYGTMYDNAEEVMGYTITGEYEEWMGEKMGIPAILIELPSHSGNYLQSQLKAILRMTTL